jgi:hypothetical protein
MWSYWSQSMCNMGKMIPLFNFVDWKYDSTAGEVGTKYHLYEIQIYSSIKHDYIYN